VIETASEAIVLGDSQGRILCLNRQAQELFGYAKQQLEGQAVDRLVPEWFEHIARLPRADLLLDGRRSSPIQEVFARHRSGYEFPIHLVATLLPNESPVMAVVLRPIPHSIPEFEATPAALQRQQKQDASALERSLAQVALLLAAERQNAVLRTRLRTAQQSARAATARLRDMQELTDTALSHLALDDLLHQLLARIQTVMSVSSVGILLMDPDSQQLRLRASLQLEGAMTVGDTIPVGQGLSGRVAITHKPVIANDLATFPLVYPGVRERERSAASVPLIVGERFLGTVYVGSVELNHFADVDIQLLQRAADRIALAIDRASAYEAAEAARAEAEAARAAAQRHAEQLDRVIEAMAEGVTVWDTEGHLVRTNAALRRLLAFDAAPADYLQRPQQERMALFGPRDLHGQLLAAEDWPASRALRGEVLTGPSAVDVQMRAFDGRDVVFTASAAPLRDQGGHIVGAVGILRDQTERLQLECEREAAHAQAESRAEELDRVFEQTSEGLAVYDAAGQLVRSNAALRRLLGLDAAAPGHDQLPLHQRAIPYQVRDRDGHLLSADRVWTSLREGGGDGMEGVDLQWRTLDGRELQVRISAAPLRAHDDRFVGTVAVVHDQTQQRKLERALAEQAEQLERIVEAMGEGLFVYDAEGNVLRTNAAARRLLGVEGDAAHYLERSAEERLAGYTPRDRDGRPLTAAELPITRARYGGPALTAPETWDITMQTVDGRMVEVSATWAPLRTHDGQAAGTVLLLSDRTEQNRLMHEREETRASELALLEVNERLDTFADIAAHDLRAPVSVSRMVVQRTLQLLQQAVARAERAGHVRQASAAAQAAQAVETIRRNLDRLLRLVQQLVDVSRVKAGTLVLQRQPVDLAELVRTAVEDQRLLNPTRVIAFDAPEAPAAPVVVDADPDRLGQVVMNYLGNAVRYSRESQPIEVTLETVEPAAGDHAGPAARVAVRDHGSGIAPEDQDTIWDRFQRARNALEAEGGLGLGLYIARTMVERHGGKYGVESTLGQGSTFWFTVPLAAAAG
jgi:PAS domain S-box-containing protein